VLSNGILQSRLSIGTGQNCSLARDFLCLNSLIILIVFLICLLRLSHLVFEFINVILSSWVMLQENLQWHGITSKKKGQKWGIEKVASYKRNEWTSSNQESSEMLAAEIETIANNPMDFDKLTPYTSVPKVCFFHT
jgi:hypothetical protein